MFLTKYSTWSSTILFLVAGLFLPSCNLGDEVPVDPPDPEPNQEGVLYDVAGVAGEAGFSGDGGLALDAHLSSPQDVTVSISGDIYVVDTDNNCIRKIDSNGVIVRYIGTGNAGDGTTGMATQVDLEKPSSMTIDRNGGMWISSWINQKIKFVDPLSLAVSVPVGTSQGFSGDGGPADQAQLDFPSSVLFDIYDDMYISDQANQRIRKVEAASMNISTFAGNGQKGFLDGPADAAMFSFPSGIGAVPGGRIAWGHHPYGVLIADTENHRIRFINLETLEVFTVIGTGQPGYFGDNGPARNAQINYPTDIYYTSEDHDLFFADTRNHVIRKMDAIGNITTIVGTGVAGSSPDGTPATTAKLNSPCGLFFHEATRTLYIADTGNHQIKRVIIKR